MGEGRGISRERERGWLMETPEARTTACVFEEQKTDAVVGAGEQESFQK